MLRALLGRWRRFRLSRRRKLAHEEQHEEGAIARALRLRQQFDVQMAAVSRQIDAMSAAAHPSPPRGPGRFQKAYERAERRVQALASAASVPRGRRRCCLRKRSPEAAASEMKSRLEALSACLADFEVERDRAADRAVEWHHLALLAIRVREKSLVREALLRRREEERVYLSCAIEARKLRAILDELLRAASAVASSGHEPPPPHA
ncbi:MAG: hypothetical protein U0441_31800 [Polyangiaceae bacterium]